MRISVVIPLYNEAVNLDPLYERLNVALDRIACDFELVFVNDGSTDQSVTILERLADQDSHVKFISLSRNFGHEIASTAGLDAADGDAVVLMDADLQDPPELIEKLLEPWLQGCDVVYARRRRRHGEGFLKQATSFLFYRLMMRLSSLNLPLDTGDFRLMDRRVVEAFRQFSESQRFVRGLVTWMGFRQAAVEYDRPARHAGEGKYSTMKLIKLGMDAVLSFSAVPLRLVSVLGLICILTAILAAGGVMAGQLWSGDTLSGNTITNLCLVLFSGTQLVGLGIIGEYVGRVHREVLNRPLYLIERQKGWGAKLERGRSIAESRTRSARSVSDHSHTVQQEAA